ncbi:nucleoside triphosphate pyrophosphohydrolase family protein [Salisediminibacterium beveridgei]|uniref:Uncharacterized protein n=1 Tax=Salisediminibacterium beveridgei TaxID=632773 RepID=A0A1D7QV15_9BACI|nr:hypothetical protein [Salisediminibacterium beveridgei]AOM82854.1 hypothetical protein BBEV_1491 [Salisediminibacterium beveridgei]
MTNEELLKQLREKGFEEVLELIEDAQRGNLEELELVKSLGLLRDEALNQQVLQLLENEGVSIIYVSEDDV